MNTMNTMLTELRQIFDSTVAAVARRCSIDGKIDTERFDAHQALCFELALAGAELLAAETAMAQTQAVENLDASLARLFASDAIVAVGARLDSVLADAELDRSELHALLTGKALAALRRFAASHEVIEAIGRQVSKAGAEVGEFALHDDAAMARSAFQRFATESVAPMAEKIHRHDLTVPDDLLQQMREMGVFGLSIPEHFGGTAPDGKENVVVMIAVTEALSEASLAAAGSLITRPEILARALMAGGTPAQKAHWLPKIAQGEPLCAIAITEPDFGSDVASLSLKATPTDGGWLLDGAKTWCTFAGKAGLMMVVARTNPDRTLGHRGLSIMLVEKPSDDGHAFDFTQSGGGRLVGRAIPTIGYRGMHSFDLSFDRFFVPDNCVVGESAGLGKGFYFTMAGMVGGRMQTAARACGVMRAALKAAVRYADDRKVFGRPLANCALTQVKLARMASRLAACRLLTYTIGNLLESGEGGRVEASLVKLFACRSAESITREALQIHGGMGYAEETPVSRYFVDARVLSIFEGAEETLALKVIARNLFDQALVISHA